MVIKTKSFLSAVALGSGFLFFGPATSDAQAQHAGPSIEFRGQFPLPHGSIDYYASNGNRHGKRYRNGNHYRDRQYSRHSRPHYGRSYSRYSRHHRPYRLERVYVYDPYPRWVHRRVYYSTRIAPDYCPPY